MLTDETTLPVSKSTTEGTPTPTASILPSPTVSIISASWSTSASPPEWSVGLTSASLRLTPRRAATATLVPPRSTPITFEVPENDWLRVRASSAAPHGERLTGAPPPLGRSGQAAIAPPRADMTTEREDPAERPDRRRRPPPRLWTRRTPAPPPGAPW